jgi:hypothetical protein
MFHRTVCELDPISVPVTARSRPSADTATLAENMSGTFTVAAAAGFSELATSHNCTSLSGARPARTSWSRVARMLPSGLKATDWLPPFSDGSAAGFAGLATFHRNVFWGNEPVAARTGATGLNAKAETVDPPPGIVATRRGAAGSLTLHRCTLDAVAVSPPTASRCWAESNAIVRTFWPSLTVPSTAGGP